MKARLTIALEAHEWYPGEPITATIDLPPLAYGMELVQARSDAESPLLPKSWRANPAALIGARIAATALHLPLAAVIATARPVPGLEDELAGTELPTGVNAAVDEASAVPADVPPWLAGRKTRTLARVLRVLTWVGLGVVVLGLAYGWARHR